MASMGAESDAALEGLMGTSNVTLLTGPVLKATFVSSYPLIVAAYALLVICGALLNLAVLGWIVVRRLHRQPTMCLLANLAVAHLLECLVGLPITLTAMVNNNWFMGQFLCYFLPMLQDVPTHVAVMSFVMIAYDRYRFIEDPSKPRLPAIVFAVGSWLTSSCIIVPYPIYTTYIEVDVSRARQAFNEPNNGPVQVCLVNLSEDIQDYTRCIFVFMYLIPAIVLSYLYAQTTRILKVKETPVMLVLYDTRSARSPRSSTASVHTSYRRSLPVRASLYQAAHVDSAELDLQKEKRTQKYLISMTAAFYTLFAPLNLMRLMQSHLNGNETYENSVYFDSAWLTCVWVGYLPTCSMPLLFASWMLSRSEKERVRGYFRFSNRRLTRSGLRSARDGSGSDSAADGGVGTAERGMCTPGVSPPHAAGLTVRTGSVATASTAVTNLSPPSSPLRPSPRPSPRPARNSEPAPLAAAAAAPQVLSEGNLLKHDLQRAPSQRARVPASPLSPSTLSSTSSSRNTNSSSSYGPVHNPFLPPLGSINALGTLGLGDALDEAQPEVHRGPPGVLGALGGLGGRRLSDSTTASTPSSVGSGMIPEPSRQPSRQLSQRAQHQRMSSRRRRHPEAGNAQVGVEAGAQAGAQAGPHAGPAERLQRKETLDRKERAELSQRMDVMQQRMESSHRTDALHRLDSSHRTDGMQRLDSSHRTDGLARLDSSHRTDGLARLDSSHRTDGMQRLDSSHRTDGMQRHDSSHRTEAMHRLDSSHRTDGLQRLDSSHRGDGMSRLDSHRADGSQRRDSSQRVDEMPQTFHQAVNQGLHKPPQPPRYFTFDHVGSHPHYYRP